MHLKRLFVLIILCSLGFVSCWAITVSAAQVQLDISAEDPAQPADLGSNEMLYLLVKYDSDVPLRFQVTALLNGHPLEVGATRNPPVLHAPGRGEALVWIGYKNPTHIDAVRVAAIGEEWQKLATQDKSVTMTWYAGAATTPRQPAAWVDSLLKTERRESDFVYDPEPEKYGLLYDLLFFLTVASIPFYLAMQLYMLWRYKYRWRELAVIPLFPYLILAFYAIAGLNIDRSLQVTFLFRYTPFALLYLICLWLAKRYWQNKLPPPKLYKPPKQ